MAWQLVTVVAVAVLPTLTPLRTATWSTAVMTRTPWWTALAIAAVVKAWIAALLLAASAITATLTAPIALAFKTRRAWRAIAA